MEIASSTTDLRRVIMWIIFLVRDRAEFRSGLRMVRASFTCLGSGSHTGELFLES